MGFLVDWVVAGQQGLYVVSFLLLHPLTILDPGKQPSDSFLEVFVVGAVRPSLMGFVDGRQYLVDHLHNQVVVVAFTPVGELHPCQVNKIVFQLFVTIHFLNQRLQPSVDGAVASRRVYLQKIRNYVVRYMPVHMSQHLSFHLPLLSIGQDVPQD